VLSAAFETFDFRPEYQVDIDPEFPGDGDWHAPTYFFDRESTVSESSGDSRWGAPLVIRVTTDQKQWIGTFTAGIDASTVSSRAPTRVVSVVLLRDSPTS
jgi:hypothetical protein